MIFWLILTITLLCVLVFDHSLFGYGTINKLSFVNNYSQFFFVLMAFVLVFLTGFRKTEEYDFTHYQYIYNNISINNLIGFSKSEWGYSLLNLIFKNLGIPFQLLLVFVASISISIKFWFFKRFSPYPWLSILLYFPFLLYVEYGICRQGLAMSLVLLSIPYIISGKLIRALIIIIMASFFHISALIFLLVYCVYRLNWNRKGFIIALVISILVGLVDVKPMLLNIFPYLPGYLVNKLMVYINYPQEVGWYFFTLSYYNRVLLMALFIMYLNRKGDIINILVAGYFISILLFAFANVIPEVGLRQTLYFKQFEMVLLPMLFPIIIKHKNISVFLFCMIAMYAFFRIYQLQQDFPDVFLKAGFFFSF